MKSPIYLPSVTMPTVLPALSRALTAAVEASEALEMMTSAFFTPVK